MGPDSAAQASFSLDIDTEALHAAFSPRSTVRCRPAIPNGKAGSAWNAAPPLPTCPRAHGLTPVFTTNDLPTKAYCGFGLVVARAG